MMGLALTLVAAAGLATARDGFDGTKAGEERTIAGLRLCWCPPGKFTMGSPPGEPERRPDEDQVQVTLTRGFWTEKYEVTQGDWKRVVGRLPGELTAELPEGDVYSVGNVNFPEAEAFCRKLTELARRSGDLPGNWEFRLPTEAQWEYACRAGTTTATAFGDELSSKQANLKGKPYNGAESAPSLGKAARVGSYPPNAWGLHDMHGNTFRVVPGLVPRQAARRGRSRPARRALQGAAEPDGRRLAGAPGRGVDRRRLALPVGLRLRFEPDRSYDHIGFRVVAVRR